MAKAIFAVVLLLALTVLATAGGRANMVRHVDSKTHEIDDMLVSAGSCRHHLTAHPDDVLLLPDNTTTKDPTRCN